MQGTIDLTLDMVFEKSLRTLGEPALTTWGREVREMDRF